MADPRADIVLQKWAREEKEKNGEGAGAGSYRGRSRRDSSNRTSNTHQVYPSREFSNEIPTEVKVSSQNPRQNQGYIRDEFSNQFSYEKVREAPRNERNKKNTPRKVCVNS